MFCSDLSRASDNMILLSDMKSVMITHHGFIFEDKVSSLLVTDNGLQEINDCLELHVALDLPIVKLLVSIIQLKASGDVLHDVDLRFGYHELFVPFFSVGLRRITKLHDSFETLACEVGD